MSSQSFDIDKDEASGRSGVYRQVEGLSLTPNGPDSPEVWRTRLTGLIPAEAFDSTYSNGQVLTTDGSGNLTFQDPSGGPGVAGFDLTPHFLLMGG